MTTRQRVRDIVRQIGRFVCWLEGEHLIDFHRHGRYAGVTGLHRCKRCGTWITTEEVIGHG